MNIRVLTNRVYESTKTDHHISYCGISAGQVVNRSNLIAYAEYFESYADAYSDAGLYLQAVLLNFYAWLFANSA